MSENAEFLKAYALPFIGITAMLSFAISGIESLIGLDDIPATNVIIAMLGAFYCGERFYKKNAHRPDGKQKRKFALIAMAADLLFWISLGIPVYYLAQAYAPEKIVTLKTKIDEIPYWIWAIVVTGFLTLHCWIMAWGFGYGAKLSEKAEVKKREKEAMNG